MRSTMAVGLILSLLAASPASAGPRKQSRGAAIVKWTAIGAAAGFGLGFLGGMNKYDDAAYAEQKIWQSAWTGALVGGALGGAIGSTRVSQGWAPSSGRPRRPLSAASSPRVRLKAPAARVDPIYRHLFDRTAR